MIFVCMSIDYVNRNSTENYYCFLFAAAGAVERSEHKVSGLTRDKTQQWKKNHDENRAQQTQEETDDSNVIRKFPVSC